MKSISFPILAALLLNSCSSGIGESPEMAPVSFAGERQIQRTGRMSLKSRSLQTSTEKSIALVARHQALITTSSLTDDFYEATIRVPAAGLSSLMESLESVGKVTSSQINLDDVTDEYLDLEAAIKNKRALRDRLRALLARASKVEDILKIESELSRVQTELDQMEATMNSMRSQTALSTLGLSITRQRIPGPFGVIKDGTGWILGKLNYLN